MSVFFFYCVIDLLFMKVELMLLGFGVCGMLIIVC